MWWQFPVSSGLGQTSLVGHYFRHGIIGSHGIEPLSGQSRAYPTLSRARVAPRVHAVTCPADEPFLSPFSQLHGRTTGPPLVNRRPPISAIGLSRFPL